MRVFLFGERTNKLDDIITVNHRRVVISAQLVNSNTSCTCVSSPSRIDLCRSPSLHIKRRRRPPFNFPLFFDILAPQFLLAHFSYVGKRRRRRVRTNDNNDAKKEFPPRVTRRMPENEDSRKVERGENKRDRDIFISKRRRRGKTAQKGNWIMSASMKGSDLEQKKSLGKRFFVG